MALPLLGNIRNNRPPRIIAFSPLAIIRGNTVSIHVLNFHTSLLRMCSNQLRSLKMLENKEWPEYRIVAVKCAEVQAFNDELNLRRVFFKTEFFLFLQIYPELWCPWRVGSSPWYRCHVQRFPSLWQAYHVVGIHSSQTNLSWRPQEGLT